MSRGRKGANQASGRIVGASLPATCPHCGDTCRGKCKGARVNGVRLGDMRALIVIVHFKLWSSKARRIADHVCRLYGALDILTVQEYDDDEGRNIEVWQVAFPSTNKPDSDYAKFGERLDLGQVPFVREYHLAISASVPRYAKPDEQAAPFRKPRAKPKKTMRTHVKPDFHAEWNHPTTLTHQTDIGEPTRPYVRKCNLEQGEVMRRRALFGQADVFSNPPIAELKPEEGASPWEHARAGVNIVTGRIGLLTSLPPRSSGWILVKGNYA